MAGKINLINELKKCFGFNKFKGNQEAIIQNLLDGRDTFVLMPTGGGKSLCYQLPSLLMEGTAIVISPLIALMKNQVDAMRNFSEEDGIAHFINSSLNKGAIDQVKSDILAGKTKLLYVAPESLTKEENVDFLRSVKISFYAVDEAHCISEWGHDFRPEYRRIRPIINEIGKAPLIALTATATPKVQHDIQKNLGMVDAQVFKSSFNRPNLYYEVRAKTANIDRDIIKFIKNNPEKSGIAFEIGKIKNQRIRPEEFISEKCEAAVFRQIYREYEEQRKRRRKIDFDDMLVLCFQLFLSRPDVLRGWQKKFRYILIDEFQDINQIQYDVIRMLALPERNLFAVGDDDQAIYGFRGADSELMLRFKKDFPDASQILLGVNYRSTSNIVTNSLKVIMHNTRRYEKELKAERKGGPCLHIQEVKDVNEEAEYIAGGIKKSIRSGTKAEDIAVLFRTHTDARPVVESLLARKLPFAMKEHLPNLYEHFIAKDIPALFKPSNASPPVRAPSPIIAITL